MPMNFFLWGCLEDQVYVPSLQSLHGFKDRISQALESIVIETLREAWDEITYRLDVIRFSFGAHTEHIKVKNITF